MYKSNKAITLIALIITIIVLLVLTGVTINMVLSENGLFNKAKTSVGKYENAQKKENNALSEYEVEIDNASRETITLDKATYDQLISDVNMMKTKNNLIYLYRNDNSRNLTSTKESDILVTTFSNTDVQFSIGDKLVYYDNGIKIGKDVHHVKCSYTIAVYGLNSNMWYCCGQLSINNIGASNGVVMVTDTVNNMANASATCILEVNENDIIRLCINARRAGTITLAQNSLMIEVID